MITFSSLLAFVFILMLLACIPNVIFGQVMVRNLRKNKKTKDSLGLEYVSGWDIVNVVQALAFPRSRSNKRKNSRLYLCM